MVIAIISILAAILFPVFAQAREKARQTVCLSNLRQLATAFVMYTSDYDEMMPGSPDGPAGSGVYGGWVWYSAFLGDNGITKFDVTRGGLYPYVKNPGVYVCPDDPTQSGCSYELNSYLVHASPAVLQQPSSTPLLIPEDSSGTANDGYFNVPLPDRPFARHSGGTDLAFCDGHVKWEKWNNQQLYAACRGQ